jgi:uncharacterized protein YndB with AHSA1/START domain
MLQPSSKDRTTKVSQIINLPREDVYQAFLEADAVAQWLPPDGMRGHIDLFEPYEGGKFRISLTYENPEDSLGGKTSEDTDTAEGKFVELLPNEKIVWVSEFDSDQPEYAGEMRITWSLADSDGGTEVSVLCEGIPTGIRLEDNELGSKQSLQKLAAFVERGNKD